MAVAQSSDDDNEYVMYFRFANDVMIFHSGQKWGLDVVDICPVATAKQCHILSTAAHSQATSKPECFPLCLHRP